MTEYPGTDLQGRLALSLVIPVYNEVQSIDVFMARIDQVFAHESLVSLELVFVNDGSVDDTLVLLLERQKTDPRIRVVDLSRNFGKEAALSAGLQAARGQAVVPIDVDLQDPPEVILEMIAHWRNGAEVVLGHRINRDSDSWAKQVSANGF